MRFMWPEMLWLLALAPMLVALYVWLLRRRTRAALRYASLDLVRQAIGPAQRFRRHVPPLIFLIGLVAVVFATARPSALITLPSQQETIIMAMDVSLSMRATDVEPSRIAAAQTAAKAFVQDLPRDVRVGIVTFAGAANLVQKPTENRDELVAAIDRFELQRHTAIGSGIILSLATLFPDDGIDLEVIVFKGFRGRDGNRGVPLDQARKSEKKEPRPPVPPGSYANGAIILLTDGRTTTGPDPMEAAKMAADRGVRVHTVGFGTAQGATANVDGWSMFMRFDEETLKNVANTTRAEYFHAGSASDLKKVYETLSKRIVLERKETELSALFTAGAALLVIVASLLSAWWFNRST